MCLNFNRVFKNIWSKFEDLIFDGNKFQVIDILLEKKINVLLQLSFKV